MAVIFFIIGLKHIWGDEQAEKLSFVRKTTEIELFDDLSLSAAGLEYIILSQIIYYSDIVEKYLEIPTKMQS